ncbi:hypothetical protein MLD38_037401 [Melastoma candidum]|uniref:Uncharacterized protein n=1 Tax=Melastoma candidum TaxID=119954 RepID=A0ACB9LNT2_9MYRT|nr:hypothetical protein MLD38_037401 [Melastoma candidum]
MSSDFEDAEKKLPLLEGAAEAGCNGFGEGSLAIMWADLARKIWVVVARFGVTRDGKGGCCWWLRNVGERPHPGGRRGHQRKWSSICLRLKIKERYHLGVFAAAMTWDSGAKAGRWIKGDVGIVAGSDGTEERRQEAEVESLESVNAGPGNVWPLRTGCRSSKAFNGYVLGSKMQPGLMECG